MRRDLALFVTLILSFLASGCTRSMLTLPGDVQPAPPSDLPDAIPPCAACEAALKELTLKLGDATASAEKSSAELAVADERIKSLTAQVAELESRPPETVTVEVERTTTEADYWDDIAGLVELGELDDTDDVLNIADILKERGRLTDLSRLDPWQPKMVKITDDNRAAIIAAIRGGP